MSGGDAEEKAAVVQEIHAPGVLVSLVARPAAGSTTGSSARFATAKRRSRWHAAAERGIG